MLADLAGFLADDGIDTPPIVSKKHPNGKAYRIPSPDAETGLRLTTLANLGVRAAVGVDVTEADLAQLNLDDGEELDFLRQVLGSAYDELVADGVSWVRIQRLGRFAFLHFALSPESAAAAVERSAAGEAPAPNRQTRRASRPGSSGTARPTRSRGSNAGTTSRKK